MEMRNHTNLTEFILLGFSTDPCWQVILFVLYLLFYLSTMAGNMTLVFLIWNDHSLHTPMYFFTGNLSFMDFWYTSVCSPRILVMCLSEDKRVSLLGCAAQFFFSCVAAYGECYLLVAMSYDRYVAICSPLIYSAKMSTSLCVGLVVVSYIGRFLKAIAHTTNTFRMSFCRDNTIDHFYCDVLPLIKMICTDTRLYMKITPILDGFTVASCLVPIVASYLNILPTILRIRPASGRRKAFSTFASHLVSVRLFYESLLFIYSNPSSHYHKERTKVGAMFYTLINPLINRLIHSLRKKHVKEAFRKATQTIEPQLFFCDVYLDYSSEAQWCRLHSQLDLNIRHLQAMERGNHTMTEFILLGFSTDPGTQLVLFVLFLAVYSTTLLGNTTLILLICNDCRLHTPMYFFIGNLSFLDLWYSSVYSPKILLTCISEDKSISFAGCLSQLFFSAWLGSTECYLLAAMAYDRYVAILKPLLYVQAMSGRLCFCLVLFSYTGGLCSAIILTSNIFMLEFCFGNVIDDFFCDLPPLVKLACSVKESYKYMLYFLLAFNVVIPIVLILASYLCIIASILRIRSTQGRLKAFSTCSSHLISVTLYYGSILYIYSRPSSSHSLEKDKVLSAFYTVVFPMLNPMIYSLRNKDVKEALKQLLELMQFKHKLTGISQTVAK
ncbi:LOW QUALITY PROTEIN: uncharacterized protein RHO17_018072 [Thomomys bottae]